MLREAFAGAATDETGEAADAYRVPCGELRRVTRRGLESSNGLRGTARKRWRQMRLRRCERRTGGGGIAAVQSHAKLLNTCRHPKEP